MSDEFNHNHSQQFLFRLQIYTRPIDSPTVPMASASSIDDLLQCPICLDVLHDPKVLDCQHTFCANCLAAHLAATRRVFGTTNSIDCKCRLLDLER